MSFLWIFTVWGNRNWWFALNSFLASFFAAKKLCLDIASVVFNPLWPRVRYSEQNRHHSAFKLHEYFSYLCVLFFRRFQLWPVSFLHKDIYILFSSEIKDIGSLVWRKEKMPSWYSELKDVRVNWSEEGFGNPGWKWEFSKQSFQLVCSLSSLQVLASIKKTARPTILTNFSIEIWFFDTQSTSYLREALSWIVLVL